MDATMLEGPALSPVSNVVVCPRCGYAGHGFMLIELIPAISPVVPRADGFLARLDRAELRYDEVKNESDQLECPACRKQFPISESLNLGFAERNL